MTPHPASISNAPLRSRAEGMALRLPPLLAQADLLAKGIVLGDHGRRRPGQGDQFWQYRPAIAGDAARAIDWRRSARSDQPFVQQKEWQAAQTLILWADRSASMSYASQNDLPTKADRAALLALALSVLLVRGGERVGLTEGVPAGRGPLQLERLTGYLQQPPETQTDYGTPDVAQIPRHATTVFLSDFFGDMTAIETALLAVADKGIRGALVQVLDPAEEAFPFHGRTLFESMTRTLSFETRKARDLRDRYRDRLAARKDMLATLARRMDWQYHCHHTNDPAPAALLWLYHAIEARH